MEQRIFSKFNLYDQVGYLLVGAITIIIIVFDVSYFFEISIPSFNLNLLIVWFVIAYFLGHVTQSIANLINEIPFFKFLVSENKSEFTTKEKEILEQAKKYFNVEKQDENGLWNFCYVFALAKDITGNVQVFNANYSLYRGWFVVFFLQSLFILYQLLFLQYSLQILWLFIGSIFFTFLFYKRSKRFWNYMRSKVLETFIVVKALSL